MDANVFAKRVVGRRWVVRDEVLVRNWMLEVQPLLSPLFRVVCEMVVVGEVDVKKTAEELGKAWPTVRWRLAVVFEVFSVLAQSLSKERFAQMFVSVLEYEFSKEVTVRELTECLFGRYNQSTQVVSSKWIPRVIRGEVNLPRPTKKSQSKSRSGQKWVFTKEQAEIWRDWYVSHNEEVNND